MKLKVNFSISSVFVKNMSLSVFSLLAAALALFTVYMLADVPRIKKTIPVLEERLKFNSGILKALPDGGKMADYREAEELAKRAERVNRLGMSPGPGISSILAALEKAAPKGVFLTGLSYDASGRLIKINAVTESPGLISLFIKKAEACGEFDSVILERQGQKDGTATEFTLGIKAAGR